MSKPSNAPFIKNLMEEVVILKRQLDIQKTLNLSLITDNQELSSKGLKLQSDNDFLTRKIEDKWRYHANK